MKNLHGTHSMPETAENVAEDFRIARSDQDLFALRSQQKASKAISSGRLAQEIVPVIIPQKKGDATQFTTDEHPRETTLEQLSKLKGVVKPEGTVTVGMRLVLMMVPVHCSWLRRRQSILLDLKREHA